MPYATKTIVAAIGAVLIAVGGILTGTTPGVVQSPLPRISFVQVRSAQVATPDTQRWLRWDCRVTYRDEQGRIERDVPVIVEVERH